VDPSLGIIYTPSEPILAKAAIRYLCGGKEWALSLKKFNETLPNGGSVDKGPRGELFSRLILTLAHDSIIGVNATEERVWGYRDYATDRSFNKAIPTFTVHQFLNVLYSTSYHTAINAINENILQGRMNFLMFDSTNEHLTLNLFQPLCYKPMFCTAVGPEVV
jgi:hypothetical protein